MQYSENPLTNLQVLPQELIKKICKSLDKLYIKKNISKIVKVVNDIKGEIKDDFYANEHASRDFPLKTYTIRVTKKDGSKLEYTIYFQKRNEYYEGIMRMAAFGIIEIRHNDEVLGRININHRYVLWSSEEDTIDSTMDMENSTENNVKFTRLFMRTFDDTAYPLTYTVGGGTYIKTNNKFGNHTIYTKNKVQYIKMNSNYINISTK